MRFLVAAFPLALSACATSFSEDVERLEQELDRLPPRASFADAAPDLSGELALEAVLENVRTRNPELREAAGRARAGFHAVDREGSLDDPQLRVRTEGVPLRQPSSVNRAEENALGLEQMIPFPGNLGLRSEAALREAESLKEMARQREREVVARAKRSYYEYYSAQKELETHLEHIRLLEGFEKVSEVRFRTGAVSQQDILKPQVEIVLLQTDVLSARQRIASAQAALNALMGRAASAPLGAPREPSPSAFSGDLAQLILEASASHPDVLASALRVKATRAQLDLARREANLPSFSLGVEYMQVPGEPDGWTGMFGINLPWFTGKRRAEIRRLEDSHHADAAALDGARVRVQADVRDAYARVEATGKALRLLRDELLPKTGQTVEVSRAGYERGQTTFLELLDSERSLRDVRLRYYQTLSMHESSLADLERSVGREMKRNP
jgi:outer membrane protein, heavy metal efflux system